MPIRYCAIGVSRNGQQQVVVTAGNGSGNVAQVVEDLVSRVSLATDDRKSYTADQVTFHYIVASGIVYLCVADDQFPVSQAYHFLQTLQNEWTRWYGARGSASVSSSASAEFGRKMETLLQNVSAPANSAFSRSSSGPSDKVEMVSRQIDEVKKQMVSNLDTVLARGERIEALVEATSTLNTSSQTFRKTAVSLKRHMWWKNAKCWIILGVVLLIIAFAIALIICKGNFKTCGGNSTKKPNNSPHPGPSPSPTPQPLPPITIPPIQLPPALIVPPTAAPHASPPSAPPVVIVPPVTSAPVVVVEPAPVASEPAPVASVPAPVEVKEPVATPVEVVPIAAPVESAPVIAAPVAEPTQTAPVAEPVHIAEPTHETAPVAEPVHVAEPVAAPEFIAEPVEIAPPKPEIEAPVAAPIHESTPIADTPQEQTVPQEVAPPKATVEPKPDIPEPTQGSTPVAEAPQATPIDQVPPPKQETVPITDKSPDLATPPPPVFKEPLAAEPVNSVPSAKTMTDDEVLDLLRAVMKNLL